MVAQLSQRLSQALLGDCHFWLLDSVSVPVCRLERVDRCRRFAGLAHCSREGGQGGFFYGFRLHLRLSPDGVIGQVGLAPAHVSDLAMTEELLPPGGGLSLGDRNYWSPRQRNALALRGWQLEAPFRRRTQDPTPARSRAMSAVREWVETTIGQLTERFRLKRTWARDLWHLSHRIMRKVLSHTIAAWFNIQAGLAPLQLAWTS
ncbi:MAG: family transposase [Pedosphaera sp.]|nr:family transposase [Pedosphaera sp.]